MKRIISLLIALALAFSFAACGGRQGGTTNEPYETPTQAPTEEPTEVPAEKPTEAPTQAPTEDPTAEPAPKHEYSYDDATRTYEDEFLSFVLPKGYAFASDSTNQMQSVYPYELYLSFVTENTEDFASNVGYMVYKVGGAEPNYASMSAEAVRSLMEQTYEMLGGTIEEIDYSSFSGNGYSGMCYEFSANLSGIACNQITWSIAVGDTCVTIIYSYVPDETDICHASIDSIVVK